MRAVEFFESTGREIKKWFANQGVKVKVRNIRGKYIHVAPVEGDMPNEFRKMVIDKVPFFQDANITDMDNIDYGNVRARYIAISPDQWDMVMTPEAARQLGDPSREVMVVKDGKVIVIDAENEAEYLENGWELAESVNEGARQLGDPSREVMVVKNGKVIVIDAENEAEYLENGWELAESVNEGAMSDIDILIKQGKSAEEIANDMNVDVKIIEKLMGGHKKSAQQGRPRAAPHIENIRFWDLSDDELRFIMKDASEAMDANPEAEKAITGPGNWADQVNDAHTVLGWRNRNPKREAKRKAERQGTMSKFAEDEYETAVSSNYGDVERFSSTPYVKLANTDGYEKAVLSILKDNGIGGYFSGGILYVDMRDVEDAKHSVKIAMNRKGIRTMPEVIGEDTPSVIKKAGRRAAGSWGRPGSKKQKRAASKSSRQWNLNDLDNGDGSAEDKLESEGPYAIVWHGQYLEWYGDGDPAEGEGRYKPKGDAGSVLAKNIPTYAMAQKLLPTTEKMSDVGDDGDHGEDHSLVTNSSEPEIVPMSELGKHFYGYDPDSQEYGAKPEQDDHRKVMDLRTKMIDISQPEVGYVESTASAWESYKNTPQKKKELTKYLA